MLSYDAFIKKHAKRYAGLSESDRRCRYDDYKKSNGPAKSKPAQARQARARGGGNGPTETRWVPRLSNCAVDYGRVLVDPFNGPDHPNLPCIPDFISLPSHKFKTTMRIPFNSGTASTAWVAINPFSVANDIPLGQATNSSYTGTSYDLSQPFGNYVQIFPNSPFNNASLIGPRQPEFRLVACGLRVRYTGALLNQGGTLLLFRNPGNEVINSPSSFSDLSAYDVAGVGTATSRWRGVNYRPDTQTQLSYQPSAFFSAGNRMIIYVQGVAPAQPYLAEIVQYWECLTYIRETTASHADPVGMGAILASLPAKPPLTEPAEEVRGVMIKAGRVVAQQTSTIVPMLKDIGAGAMGLLGSFLGGPAGGVIGKGLGTLMMSGQPARLALEQRGNSLTVEEVE